MVSSLVFGKFGVEQHSKTPLALLVLIEDVEVDMWVADGGWGQWHLDQRSGENGVNWSERLWPVWVGYKGVSKGVAAARSVLSWGLSNVGGGK